MPDVINQTIGEKYALYHGDSCEIIKGLPDNSVHCCITSPPYYALRDYGVDGQIGREDTPAQYVARLTEVFSEVRRVLLPSGTLWLNIADTYCGTGSKGDHLDPKNPSGRNGQGVSLAQRVENVKAKDMPTEAAMRRASRSAASVR